MNGAMIDAKFSLLNDFLWQNDIDIVMLQEVSVDFITGVRGYYELCNKGYNDRGTGFLIRKGINFSHPCLSESGRLTSLAIDQINFINVYAPSGSNKRAERSEFFTNDISLHLMKDGISETICGGDFNCIIERGDNNGDSFNDCPALRTLINQMSWVDIWRHVRGNETVFTFQRGRAASRIDRFYCSSSFINGVRGICVKPLAFTDHHAVLIKHEISFSSLTTLPRSPYWKLHPFLLIDQSRSLQLAQIIAATKNFNIYRRDLVNWWSTTMKSHVKKFYKSEMHALYQNINQRRRQHEQTLLRWFQSQGQCTPLTQIDVATAKRDLIELEQEKLQLLSIKAKVSTAVEDEIVGIFHIGKILKNNKQKIQLNGNNGQPLDATNTQAAIVAAFEERFALDTSINDNHLPTITRTLDRSDSLSLIAEVTEQEIFAALKLCQKKKSPGPDGLSYEFYVSNFDSLKSEMTTMFNGLLSGRLQPPDDWSQSIVSLIPKTSNITSPNDLRPISQINTDYKILMKILSIRLKPFMQSLIGDYQTACSNNQNVIENQRCIRSLLTKAEENPQMKFVILGIDLQQAFDRVHHEYLWKILRAMNFPEQIIELFKRIYQNCSSKLIVNGVLTRSIRIQRSIRQGCPMSMMLFVLYLTPLLDKLCLTLKGIQCDRECYKIKAYADDLELIIGEEDDISSVFNVIQQFGNVSGAKLNVNKSGCLYVNDPQIQGAHLFPQVETLPILGLRVADKWSKIADINYNKLIANIVITIKSWQSRKLNLIQRIRIANQYLTSKIWYLSHIILWSKRHIAKFTSTIGNFIWSGHLYRVAKTQLVKAYNNGGLELVSIEEKAMAMWIKTALYDSKINGGGKLQEPDPCLSRQQKPLELKNAIRCVATINHIQVAPNASVIYKDLLQKSGGGVLAVESKFSTWNWSSIWQIFSLSCIPTAWRSSLYMFVNDKTPYGTKTLRHGITVTDLCSICGQVDDKFHKLIDCHVRDAFDWLKREVSHVFGINLGNAAEFVGILGLRGGQGKSLALKWILSGWVYFAIFKRGEGGVESLKLMLRRFRFGLGKKGNIFNSWLKRVRL